MCDKDVWFVLHVTMMTLVGIINLIAFLIILEASDWQWLDSSDPISFSHSIFGIIAFGLVYIQIFMGIIRPNTESRFRKSFLYIHRTTGLLAFLFSSNFCKIYLIEYNVPEKPRITKWSINELFRYIKSEINFFSFLLFFLATES